jgi:hypothetical protein
MKDEEKKKTKHIKNAEYRNFVNRYRKEDIENGEKWFGIFMDRKGWERRIPMSPRPPQRYFLPVRRDLVVVELRSPEYMESHSKESMTVEFEMVSHQLVNNINYVYYREV